MSEKILKSIQLNNHDYVIDAKYLGGKDISDIENCVKITYDELKSLRDSSKLIPGKQYRITDYITSTSQANTKSAGHQFDIIVTADDVNRLNEKARSIQHEGDTYFKDSNLSAWEIWYCLDNDTNRFSWASTLNTGVHSTELCLRPTQIGNIRSSSSSTSGTGTYSFEKTPNYIIHQGYRYDLTINERIQLYAPLLYITLKTDGSIYVEDGTSGMLYTYPIGVYSYDEGFGSPISRFAGKGVIYRMIDEFGNDCPYDFKNIMFRRYALLPPVFSGTSSRIQQMCTNVKSAFTNNLISYIWGGINNSIYHWNDESAAFYSTYISDSTFDYFYTFSYIDGEGAYPKDYSIVGNKNSSSKYCHNNVIENHYPNKNLRLNNIVFFNTFDTSSCYNNTFGNYCHNNSFGSYCYNNTFGENCYNITFGKNCYDITFGNNCYDNNFDNCYSNIFGNNFLSNSFGNTCYYNSFGSYCHDNTFGNYCYYNSFGNNCYNNSFGNTCYYNSFGKNCYNITFGKNCYNITFGNYCHDITFGTSAIKSYYRYIIVENGNNNIYLNCTATTSSTNYFQNVRIALGANNTSSDLTINDSNVNQAYETVYGKIIVANQIYMRDESI
jgi:hypothetical protein